MFVSLLSNDNGTLLSEYIRNAERPSVEVVHMLITKCNNVNHVDQRGFYALKYATFKINQNEAVIKLLFWHGQTMDVFLNDRYVKIKKKLV